MNRKIISGFTITILLLGTCLLNVATAHPHFKSGDLKEGYDFYVGVWHFDEGSGNTAADSSPFKNNANLYGTNWTNGISGKALYFDGKNDFVLVDDSTFLNFGRLDCFSLDLYIKKYPSLIEYPEGIISKRTGKFHQGYGLTMYPNNTIGFILGDGNQNYILYSKSTIDDNEWHHIVAVWDGNTQYIYIDDELDSEDYIGNITIQDDYKYLEFGNHWGYTDNYHPFHGVIDEVKIATRHPIAKPKIGCLYVLDKEIMPLSKTIIIGKITVKVDFPEINKVEFYVDGKYKYTSFSQFEWLWNEFSVGKHNIMVACYYFRYGEEKIITDNIDVLVFNI